MQKQFLIHSRFSDLVLIFTEPTQGARSVFPFHGNVPMMAHEAETFRDMEARGVKRCGDVAHDYEIREAADIRHSVGHSPANPCRPGCTGWMPPERAALTIAPAPERPGWTVVDTTPEAGPYPEGTRCVG